MKALSNIKTLVSGVILLTFFYSTTSFAALQCFSEAGTYGNLTVTRSGTCGNQLTYDGITGVWISENNSSADCQFDISPEVVGSTVEVRMTGHSVDYPSYSEEAVFSLNGSFVTVSPGDIDNSFPVGTTGLLAGTGGAGDPTVGGVTTSGGNGGGTVRFSAAPAGVSGINIQHNVIAGAPNGTVYQVCADDEGGVVEPDTAARFTITKEFSDNNPAPVEVILTCNAGLPLTQSFVINDSDAAAPAFGSVTFVVKDFADGAMDCTVTEIPTDGYLPSYLPGGDSQNDNGTPESPACRFISVGLGDANSCVVSNTLERVYFDLTKKWELGDGYDDADKVAEIEIFIENFRGSPDGPLQDHSGMFTIGDETKSFFVLPNFGTPQTRVRAVELPMDDSSIESDQGCADWIIFNVGDDLKSCTITNTAFYEGIPTLSQYSLAMLILLTLGVGLIGFRRYT